MKTSLSQAPVLAPNLLRTFIGEVSGPQRAQWAPVASRWICHSCRNRDLFPQREKKRVAWSSFHRRDIPSALQHANTLRRTYATQSNGEEPLQAGKATTSSGSLPSQAESRRSDLSKRFSSLMDHMQSNIFIAGQRLNDLTGYAEIEALKKSIENQENSLASSRNKLQEAKAAYSAAISQRSASQREVNELLQRKNAWSPQDLERFTSLYRSDHANEQTESSAQEAVFDAERAAEEASAKLSASILARYHEEQIWSDKIRRMSTWGTWGLMGVNVLLFLVFQIGVEPWRRKRLVKGFEDKVVEALEKEGIASNVAIAALKEAHAPRPEAPALFVEEPAAEPAASNLTLETPTTSLDPIDPPPGEVAVISKVDVNDRYSGIRRVFETYKAFLLDLFSSRIINVRRVDLTTATLEGAFVGMAATAMITAVLRSH